LPLSLPWNSAVVPPAGSVLGAALAVSWQRFAGTALGATLAALVATPPQRINKFCIARLEGSVLMLG
jgi:hypothetical protein